MTGLVDAVRGQHGVWLADDADDLLRLVAEHCRGQLVYLATPYSKLVVDEVGEFQPSWSRKQSDQAAYWAGCLAVLGITAVSPIVMAHAMFEFPLAPLELDPLDDKFWTAWCRPLLFSCQSVVVPPIEGWTESEGVQQELKAALTTAKQVILPVWMV